MRLLTFGEVSKTQITSQKCREWMFCYLNTNEIVMQPENVLEKMTFSP